MTSSSLPHGMQENRSCPLLASSSSSAHRLSPSFDCHVNCFHQAAQSRKLLHSLATSNIISNSEHIRSKAGTYLPRPVPSSLLMVWTPVRRLRQLPPELPTAISTEANAFTSLSFAPKQAEPVGACAQVPRGALPSFPWHSIE